MAVCQSLKTDADSEESIYKETDSDDSNSSEDDACMDDSDATASGSDSSWSLEGDLEASGDDGDSRAGKMAHPVDSEGVPGVEAEAGQGGEDRVVGEESQ